MHVKRTRSHVCELHPTPIFTINMSNTDQFLCTHNNVTISCALTSNLQFEHYIDFRMECFSMISVKKYQTAIAHILMITIYWTMFWIILLWTNSDG